MSNIEDLYERFRLAYVAGEHPDVAAFLEQAPPADRGSLGQKIREVILKEPAPEPSPETRQMVKAMLAGQAPLLELRKSKKLSREDVVAQLTKELSVAREKESRVEAYYHKLENGLLPLAGVKDKVFDAIARVMGVARSSLVLTGPGSDGAEPASGAAFARSIKTTPVALNFVALRNVDPTSMIPDDWGDLRTRDEVDDLFTGGPG